MESPPQLHDVEEQQPPPSDPQQNHQQKKNPNEENEDDDDVDLMMMSNGSDRTRSTSDKEEKEDFDDDHGDGMKETNDAGRKDDDDDDDAKEQVSSSSSSLQQQQELLMKRRRRNRIYCGCFCCSLIAVVILSALYVSLNTNTQSILSFEEYVEILDTYQINSQSSLDDVEKAMKEMITRYDNEDKGCQNSETILGLSTSTTKTTTNVNSENDDDGDDVVVVQQERRYVTSSSSSINEDTLYEIGSISKPLTGLVLAYQIELGYIESLETPINDFLPNDIPLLEVDSSSNNDLVTFRHLVSHTSGLPRLADVMMGGRQSDNQDVNPYAGYTEQDLLEQITIAANNGLSQTGNIEYSNFGFSILGYLLGNSIRSSSISSSLNSLFPEIQQNLTQNLLNMTNTYIGNTIPSEIVSSSTNKRLLKGYNRQYPDKVMPYWYDGGLFIDGAGSTLSSASDLLTLAETIMMYYNDNDDDDNNNMANATSDGQQQHQQHPLQLQNAIRKSLQPIKENNDEEDIITTETSIIKSGIAYSWFYEKHIPTATTNNNNEDEEEKIFYGHSGGTQGFTSNLVFDPNDELAVVALTNCGLTGDIGFMSGALLRKLSGVTIDE